MSTEAAGSRILIIENDEANRTMLSVLLERLDYRVVACGTAQAGLEQIQSEPFDLVISDLTLTRMPGMPRLCSVIRASYPHLPILIYTAHAFEKDRHEALMDGATAFLTKPTHLDVIHRTIQGLLGRHTPAPKIVPQ